MGPYFRPTVAGTKHPFVHRHFRSASSPMHWFNHRLGPSENQPRATGHRFFVHHGRCGAEIGESEARAVEWTVPRNSENKTGTRARRNPCPLCKAASPKRGVHISFTRCLSARPEWYLKRPDLGLYAMMNAPNVATIPILTTTKLARPIPRSGRQYRPLMRGIITSWIRRAIPVGTLDFTVPVDRQAIP